MGIDWSNAASKGLGRIKAGGNVTEIQSERERDGERGWKRERWERETLCSIHN